MKVIATETTEFQPYRNNKKPAIHTMALIQHMYIYIVFIRS